MNFGPEYETKILAANFSFGSKAKIDKLSQYIFSTFYLNSSSLPCTIQYIEKIGAAFLHFGKIWPILTFDMVKNEKF